MTQPSLWDAVKAAKVRDACIALAIRGKKPEIEAARQIARDYARKYGEADINLIGPLIAHLDLGNAAGAIFKGSEWERVGFTAATKVGSHARIVSRWRLK